MTAYRIILIAHLFGLAFGLGGASTIDSILLVACRRGRVTKELVEVIHAAAALVAGAMGLLIVSGAAFFTVGVEPSPKFWAKMVLVGVACLNGLAAHRVIFPLIESATSNGTGYLHLRPWAARLAAASAAISSVSWSGALVLGAWRGLKLGIAPILVAYSAVLIVGIVVSAVVVAPRIFVLVPARPDARRIPPMRDLPANIAYAVALVIADTALAVATRLNRKPRLVEVSTAEQFATATDSAWPDRLIPIRSWDAQVVTHARQDDLFGRGGVLHQAIYQEWPGYDRDAATDQD